MSSNYKCICGKEFDNASKFNGHKQGCQIHIENKYGSLEAYYKIKNRNHNKGRLIHERTLNEKLQKLESWISEQHTCERCGKVMTEKFGSGRFCSRACANSRPHSNEEREKISTTLKKYTKDVIQIKAKRYNKIPNKCVICGKILTYNHKNRKTCSKECAKQLQSKVMLELCKKKGIHRTSIKTYKYGTYKNIECDSSWELAFVMYMLDQGIKVERNKEGFPYTYDNKNHLYYPDFVVDDKIFYEIKNFNTAQVEAKINQFPKELNLIVLYKKDIQKYINYAIDKYGKNFYNLYDEDKPAWFNR